MTLKGTFLVSERLGMVTVTKPVSRLTEQVKNGSAFTL